MKVRTLQLSDEAAQLLERISQQLIDFWNPRSFQNMPPYLDSREENILRSEVINQLLTIGANNGTQKTTDLDVRLRD